MHEHAPDPEDSPLAPNRLSPPLAVTGFLMLGVLFLTANPEFGVKFHSLRASRSMMVWAISSASAS